MQVVTTLHGTDITIVGQDPSFRAITKFSIEKSDGLTAVSRVSAARDAHGVRLHQCNIEVIPNFIDPDVYDRARYTPVLRQQAGEGKRIFMHISNFRPVKRVRDVVRIFAGIDRGGAERARHGRRRARSRRRPRRRRASSASSDKVFFLGKLDAVAPLLAGADLFLLPSHNESFGLSALEALACGVPVVATQVGGLPEVVKRRRDGRALPGRSDRGDGCRGHRDPARSGDVARDERSRCAPTRARASRIDNIVAQYESFYARTLAARS